MRVIIFTITLLAVLAPFNSYAGSGHYASGGEGLLAATLPPEGVYWRSYLTYYDSYQNKDKNGSNTPGNFNLDSIGWINRFIFSTDFKILGANYLTDIVIPLGYTNIKISDTGYKSHEQQFGLGDIMWDPIILAWHGNRYDAVAGFGVYFPTGIFHKNNPAIQGKGYFTFMPTLGGTLYLDEEKSWHASILARYEIHTRQMDSDITYGNDFHFEYGVGKSFAEIYRLGVAGFCHWQVSDDYGKNATDARKEVYGLGPEFQVDIPAWKSTLSVRVLKEFGAKATTEGVLGVLTFTKAF